MHSMQRRKVFTISYNIIARNSSYFFREMLWRGNEGKYEKKFLIEDPEKKNLFNSF